MLADRGQKEELNLSLISVIRHNICFLTSVFCILTSDLCSLCYPKKFTITIFGLLAIIPLFHGS